MKKRVMRVRTRVLPSSRKKKIIRFHSRKINFAAFFSFAVLFFILLLAIFLFKIGFANITGNVVNAGSGCTEVLGKANGTYFEIMSPANNSRFNLQNLSTLNLSVRTDYYGTNYTETCYGLPPIKCAFAIFHSLEFVGSEFDMPYGFSWTNFLPSVKSGNKTYFNSSICKTGSCPEGGYLYTARTAYSCGQETPFETERSVLITLNLYPPIILNTYPENAEEITAYDAGYANITPLFDASDATAINKTIKTSDQVIDLTSGSRVVSLSPGDYSWNFSATDVDGYINSTIINFKVKAYVPPVLPLIQNISYSNGTPLDGEVISKNNFTINLSVGDPSTIKEVRAFVFSSNNSSIQNFSNANKLGSYLFEITGLQDGTYYYNATLVNLTDYLFNVPTQAVQVASNVSSNVSGGIFYGENTDLDNALKNQGSIAINVSSENFNSSEQNIIRVELYESSLGLIRSNETNESSLMLIYDSLANGIYFFNASLLRSGSIINSTQTRRVILNSPVVLVNESAPEVLDFYPKQNSKIQSNSVDFSIALDSPAEVLVSFDGGKRNYTLEKQDDGNIYFLSINLSSGNYTATYFIKSQDSLQIKSMQFSVENSSTSKLSGVSLIFIFVVLIILILIAIIVIYFLARKNKSNLPPQNPSTTNQFPPVYPPRPAVTNLTRLPQQPTLSPQNVTSPSFPRNLPTGQPSPI